jgi:hypothetical protein
VPVQPGTDYEAQARVKPSNVSGVATLALTFWDRDGAFVAERSPELSGTAGWQTVSAQRTAPKRAASVSVEFRLAGAGLFWADSLRIAAAGDSSPESVPEPTPAPEPSPAPEPEPSPAPEPNPAPNPAPDPVQDPAPEPVGDDPPPPVSDALNLVPNPSFESDPSSDYRAEGLATFSWGADAAVDGARSLKIESTQGDGLSRLMTRQKSIGAVPGASYEARAAVMTADLRGKAMVALTFFDRDGNDLATRHSESLAGTNDWRQLSVARTAPPGAASVRVEIRVSGGGTVWADALQLLST